MKTVWVPFAIVLVALATSSGVAEESAKEKFAVAETAEVVTIRDSKGVETIATGFGKLFGPDYLTALRGDATIQVPFDRILKLVSGKVVDSRMEVTLTLNSGRQLEVELDRPEFSTIYAGTADFGYFRMRLMDVKEVTWTRVKRRPAALGQRCPKGHIYYNDTWHFCPYDGEKLSAIKSAD